MTNDLELTGKKKDLFMAVIYKITNLINNKNYIGQTRCWRKRYRHYCSYPFNPNSRSYKRPINSAIRKYGLTNFSFEFLECFQEDVSQSLLDKRERFWIKIYKSLTCENGYNIETGGTRGKKRPSVAYEQCLELSKKFTPEEIKDIQRRLMDNEEYESIQRRYRINLTFLSNINNGNNFFNSEFSYPLKKEFHKSKYTEEQIKEIKDMIRQGYPYKNIANKYGIKSQGFISGINSGRYFFDKNEHYPLIIKSCSRRYNMETWVRDIKSDLIFTNLSFSTIEKKYNKKPKTVSRINNGRGYREDKFKYPLRTYREFNKDQF